MAVLEDVVLVADGGDVTAGRQKHTFVYGELNVQLPEGVEQVETDGRLADGYVYRPEGEIAPFDVGFARADVTVDLEVQSTDLELVVDEAQRDAEGDVFFERDITPAGLGEFVPGVDFVVGDVVSVERWRVLLPLPVTGWEMVSSASDGVVADRVHVSGQLISDSAARVRRNADLRREVEADKRQLQRSVRSVRSYADSAVSRERTERVADVAQVREVLGGPDATDTSLLSQLAAVQAQITGMGERPAQPGLLAAYLATNTALWKAQQEIDRLQNERTDELTAQLIETQKLVERARVDVVTLSRSELPWVSDLVRVRWSDADGVVVEPVNRRRSHVVATVSDGDASRVHVDTLPTRLGAQSMVLSGPAGLLSRSGVVGLVVRGAPGVERRLVRTIPGQTPRTKAWVQVAQITVPERTTSAVASLRILWASTGYKDVLGVRVRVGSRTLLEKTGVSTGSPLQGVKAQLHTAGGVAVQPGDVVIFECKNESDYVDRQVISGGEALLAVIEQSEV